MKLDKFDDCAKLSSKDFVETAKSGGLQPSIAHGMAVKPAAEGALEGCCQPVLERRQDFGR